MNNKVGFTAGYLSIIGKPNVGKSTLLNTLLEFKLSITSPKPQTTRRRVMGILNDTNCQIIFLDTPGILKPKYLLHKAMLKHIQSSILDADALLYMVSVHKIAEFRHTDIEEDLKIIFDINTSGKPVILIINKIDLIHKQELLPLLKMYSEGYAFRSMVPISARSGDGIHQLKNEFLNVLPLHPPYYDSQTLTDQPERFFVTELIREQIVLKFKEEIPYATEVHIDQYKERDEGKHFISAFIFAERETQKAILIGKHGKAIKEIGLQARKQIEKFLGRPIFLDLRVKVHKDWRKDERQIKRFGY